MRSRVNKYNLPTQYILFFSRSCYLITINIEVAEQFRGAFSVGHGLYEIGGFDLRQFDTIVHMDLIVKGGINQAWTIVLIS